MNFDGPPDTVRETQTIRVPPSDVRAFREWAVDGTGLTAADRVVDSRGRIALVKNGWSDGWISLSRLTRILERTRWLID